LLVYFYIKSNITTKTALSKQIKANLYFYDLLDI